MKNKGKVFLLLSFIIIFTISCAASKEARLAEQLSKAGNWDGAVLAYQQAIDKDPKNRELRNKLLHAKTKAADGHYAKGKDYLKEKKIDPAIEELRKSVELMPSMEEYSKALRNAGKIKEAEEYYLTAMRLQKAGKLDEAVSEFEKALELDPTHQQAQEALTKIGKKKGKEEEDLTLASTKPVTLKFQNTKIKEVFELLSKLSGVNILFDADVKNDPITVFIKDAAFHQALSLILTTNKLFMKKISEDTILIVPKTKQKIDQYQDLLIRTFYLSNLKAKDMVNLLKTMLDTKKIYINEELNAIVVREAPEKIKLAEKIIEANDRRIAEVMLDVEILEVDRQKLLKYGYSLSKTFSIISSLSGSTTDSTQATMNLNALKSIGMGNLFFTLPTASVSIDLMKQDTDAQTLANPKIRVINNKPAKIHIGDRVPIKVSTITEATGQTRNIYEYKDVGVKLTVEPNIHLGNNITIKMGFDVSSLGNNVGTATDPQYVIGSRSTETMLNLKDGEAVIVGGLIKDEERNTVDKIPLLGDIPLLGKLFSKTDKGVVKTDILMTITPRIVRNLEVPDKELQAFWSGTEENYSTKQIFAGIPTSVDIKETEAPQPAPVSPTPSPKQMPLPTTPQSQALPPQATHQPPAEPEKAPAQVSLRPSELNLQINQEIKMDVMVSGAKNLSDIFLTITYDPKIIDFKRVAEGNFLNSDNWATSFISSVNTKSGIIDIHLNRIADITGASGAGALFTLSFQGKAPGSSPILFGNNQLFNPKREAISVELKGGTVNVQ